MVHEGLATLAIGFQTPNDRESNPEKDWSFLDSPHTPEPRKSTRLVSELLKNWPEG